MNTQPESAALPAAGSFIRVLTLCATLLAAPAGALALEPVIPQSESGSVSLSSVQSRALVRYDRALGVLDVEAEQSPLEALLKTVAEQSGVGIELGSGVSGKVTTAFRGLSLEDGVTRIAEAAGVGNLAMVYERISGEHSAAAYRVQKISILGGVATAHALAQKPDNGTQVRREAPGIAGGVRVSPVLTPMNPERPGSGGAAQMPHRNSSPGESKASRPEGNSDERYVTSLIRAARQLDVHAISQLGKMRFRQAVPILERIVARSPEGSPARTAAFQALRQMAAARQTGPTKQSTR